MGGLPAGWIEEGSMPFIEHRKDGKVICSVNCADVATMKFDKANPLKTINRFDNMLKAGDWCSVAYVCYDTMGEGVAIHVVE